MGENTQKKVEGGKRKKIAKEITGGKGVSGIIRMHIWTWRRLCNRIENNIIFREEGSTYGLDVGLLWLLNYIQLP